MSSLTQQNLLRAFTGESSARNKYTMFAKIARSEDLEVVARVFEETADNERVHAGELFEILTVGDGLPAVPHADRPGGLSLQKIFADTTLEIQPFSSTLDNLKMAAEGEKFEWQHMYPDFAETAKAEKQMEAFRLFSNLTKVEEKHEERYIIIAKKLDSKTLFSSETELEWKCLNCGYIYKGKASPKKCPVCLKPYTWYLPRGEWR